MLCHNQDRQNPLLVQIGEQLVYLEHQKAFLRPAPQLAVKAVDNDHGGVPLGDASADKRCEPAGRHLRGINLMQDDITGRDQRADLHSDPACPLNNALGALVKSVEGGALALFCYIVREAESDRGLPRSSRTDEQRAGAAAQAAAEQQVELLRAAATDLLREGSRTLGHVQPWKDLQAAGSNGVIVIAAPKF